MVSGIQGQKKFLLIHDGGTFTHVPPLATRLNSELDARCLVLYFSASSVLFQHIIFQSILNLNFDLLTPVPDAFVSVPKCITDVSLVKIRLMPNTHRRRRRDETVLSRRRCVHEFATSWRQFRRVVGGNTPVSSRDPV